MQKIHPERFAHAAHFRVQKIHPEGCVPVERARCLVAIAPALHAIGAAPTVMGALGIAATAAGAGGLVVVSPMFAMQPAERERVAALPSG